METENPSPSFGKKRVILRTNGKRRQVSLINDSDSSDLEEHLAKLPVNHRVVDSKDSICGIINRNTEDIGRNNTSFPQLNSSAVTRPCDSDVRRTLTPNSYDSHTEIFTKHNPNSRIHPIKQTLPQNAFEANSSTLEAQQTWPQAKPPRKLPPILTNSVGSTPACGYEPLRSIKSPMSSLGEHTLLLSSPDFNHSGPLQPLLTASARKGGRIPSADTDWSFDGKSQLENIFPDKQISVYIATWNMHNEKELPVSLDDLLLPETSYTLPELYVIGTEETSSRKKEWEILIQQTIGPSHILLQSASLGSLHLVLFVRRDLLWYFSGVKSVNFATRPFSQFKTKGAVGLMFNLFGTSFLFITCHLTAHQQKVEERNSDYKKISSYFALPETSNDKAETTDGYDYVFWLGDLNYRVDLSREECNQLLLKSNILELLMSDQLTGEILAGNAFHDYSEQPITFFPSYKYDLNSNVYDTSQKRRTPSWTDRILFQSRDNSITGHGYYCCDTIRISDHRPVYAYFKAYLKPCNTVDGILDVVTTFDADIYNKASQRRKNNAEESQKLRRRQSSSGTRTSSSASTPTHKTVTSSYCVLL